MGMLCIQARVLTANSALRDRDVYGDKVLCQEEKRVFLAVIKVMGKFAIDAPKKRQTGNTKDNRRMNGNQPLLKIRLIWRHCPRMLSWRRVGLLENCRVKKTIGSFAASGCVTIALLLVFPSRATTDCSAGTAVASWPRKRWSLTKTITSVSLALSGLSIFNWRVETELWRQGKGKVL